MDIQNNIGRQFGVQRVRTLLLVFAGYFLLQAISRGLISETLGMDDAQESLLAQKWRWGYGPQPPLYTWLVIMFSKVFGLSSFTMALLKNALLFGIYLLTYFIARRITHSQLVAVSAAAALEFMPSIAYEAHRELTHSILASFMVLATLLAFFRLQESDRVGRKTGAYVLLGVLGGLGMISKYNYSIFYISLFMAALLVKSWRPAVLNLRAAGALGITLLIISPHLLWISDHPALAFSSAGKFDIDPTHSVKSMVHGVGSWASTCLDQAGILVLIFVLLCWREIFGRGFSKGFGMRKERAANAPDLRSRPGSTDLKGLLSPALSSNPDFLGTSIGEGEETARTMAAQPGALGQGEASAPLVAARLDGLKLLVRMFIFSGAIIVLGIIISGATNCRNRWLQPLVIPAPILVAAWCQQQLSRRRLKIILLLAVAIAGVVAIAAPGRILLTDRFRKGEALNTPFKDLADQLKQPLANVPILYCAETAMAGNLRIWFPDKIITAPATTNLHPPSFPCALVWDPSMRGSAPFLAGAAHLTGSSPASAIYVEERLKYHQSKTMRLGLLRPP